MATYDPKILQQFADNLYSKADGIVAQYTIRGVLLGALLALVSYWGLIAYLRNAAPESALIVAGLLFVVCVAGFYIRGKEKAFALRLEAQRTLCQLQLEKNTRSVVPVGNQTGAAVRS